MKSFTMIRTIFFLTLFLITWPLGARVSVTHLTVEGQTGVALGIDKASPRLGWQLTADAGERGVRQVGYTLHVASHPDSLLAGRADLYAAETSSSSSLWIPYQGVTLHSNQRAYFQVQVRYVTETSRGRVQTTEWSDIGRWGMGLLTDEDWHGTWIGLEHAMPWDVETEHSQLSARYYRTTFTPAPKPLVHATLHIAGLGLYEAYLNGKRVGGAPQKGTHIGKQVLAPAPTDYRRSIVYNSYDVTSLVLPDAARNCLAVTVSNGRYYTMQQHKKPYKIAHFGYPTLRACLVLHYADGTETFVGTNDKLWRISSDGPVRSANEYDGEVYDATKTFVDPHASLKDIRLHWTLAAYPDSTWARPERTALPTGRLRGHSLAPMQVVAERHPVAMQYTTRSSLLLDFGLNVAGWVRLPVGLFGLQAGDTLQIRFAEKLAAPATEWTAEQQRTGRGPGFCLADTAHLYTDNLRHALSRDLYIAHGHEKQGETWAPRFVYHGFRFAEVTVAHRAALPQDLPAARFTAEVVADPVARAFSFHTSHPLLNRIVDNAAWGVLDNYKGMPVDCPQRDERQPWLGDHAVGCYGESYLYDVHSLYSKWLQDIVDAQRPDGTLPGVAPAFWNYYNDDITWPSVLLFAADMLYQRYGDTEAIRLHYNAMRSFLMHFYTQHRNAATGLLDKADKYADWCVPPESPTLIHSKDPARKTSSSLISSCYLYHLMGQLASFADLLTREYESASRDEQTSRARQGLSPLVLQADKGEYEAAQSALRKAINDHFLHVMTAPNEATKGRPADVMTAPGNHYLYPDSVFYDNNTVTANLLPLAFGIVPEEHAATIERWIARQHLLKATDSPELKATDPHVTCGVIGMSWLFSTLAKMGRHDLAFALATAPSYPSYGYMALHGATTIWELWNGDTANPAMNSGNHVMLLGDLLPWCMEYVGGIAPAAPGFEKIRFAPNFSLSELPSAAVSYRTPYGLAASEWTKSDTSLLWHVVIPAGTTGEVTLPYDATKATVRGDSIHTSTTLWQSSLKKKKATHPETPLSLGSGDYWLEVRRSPAFPASHPRHNGAYATRYADSLALDRTGILHDQLVYDPFTAAHPSAHSASIAELANGDLLATFFLGAREGAPDVCIYTARKPKGCPFWQRLSLVANGDLRPEAQHAFTEIDSTLLTPIEDNVNRKACYNPVLFQIPDGDLLLFYKIGKNVRDWTGYLMRSSDNGYTWSEPHTPLAPSTDLATRYPSLCGEADSLLGAIKNQPIYLPAGFRCKDGTVLSRPRIVAPTSKETATGSKVKSGRWRCYTEISEDDGHTWALSPVVPAPAELQAIQPALLIHPDGRLQMLCRTHRPSKEHRERARIASSTSDDGGITWSPLTLLYDLPNNNSGIGAVTLKDGTFALIYNPFSLADTGEKPLRNPLAIAHSTDGLHWQHVLTLEDSPISQYSYPSLLLGSDNTLHAIYTWRRQSIKYIQFRLPY